MRKSLAKVLGIVAVGVTVGVGIYAYRRMKQEEEFAKIKQKCPKDEKTFLDDQGEAAMVSDDTVVLDTEHNCLAKKALYDLLQENASYDLNTLAEFVKHNCRKCKRKGFYGDNLGSK